MKDSFRAPRWCIVVGLLLCLVCVQGVGAYNSKAHYDLAVDALRDEGVGIDQPQIWYVAMMDNMVDFIGKAKETDWDWLIDFAIVPEISWWNLGEYDDDEIEQRLSDKAHFQHFNNYDDLNTEWIRLQEQTYRAVQDAEKRGDEQAFLAIMGMSLHTVQDFYAHSNWPEQTEAQGWPDNTTWFQVNESDKNATSRLALNSLDHAAIHKDYATRAYYERSYRQAYYASREWIQLMKTWVTPEFWDQAMAPDISTSDFGRDLNKFFWGCASFVGAWSDPYSKSYDDLFTWVTSYNTFTDAYKEPWFQGKMLGWDYLYNMTMPTFTSAEHHPANLPKVDDVRWLVIATTEVEQTDCDVFSDIDPGNDADFYPKITVRGHTYAEAPDQGEDWVLATFNGWRENIPLPIDLENVEVRYALWDDDHPVTDDDHCDIVYDYDQKDWVRTLATGEAPQTIYGYTVVETDGLRDCNFWHLSKGDGDEAYVQFIYWFEPQGTGGAAALGIQLDASPDIIHSGDAVTYTYTVTNEGTRPLSNVVVTDDTGLVPEYRGGDTNGNEQLEDPEIWTYTATKVVTTDDPKVKNTGTVTAIDVTGSAAAVTATSTQIVYVLHPAIQVEKTVSSSSIDRGESVTYTYTVTNAGDIQLSDIHVMDDKVTPIYQSGDTNEDGWLNLEEIIGDLEEGGTISPAEVWTYTATSSPTHTVTNTVTASGTDPLGWTVDSTDSATVVVTVIVNVDVKPGGCPNGLGLKDKGVIPVAILGGMPDYTLDEIDTSSIQVNGIPVAMIHSEDVATTYLGTDTCGCHNLTADGNLDAMFQVDAPPVIQTLGNPAKKSLVPLTVTGTLTDGLTLLKGSDCVKIA
jgi:hypothetical protein